MKEKENIFDNIETRKKPVLKSDYFQELEAKILAETIDKEVAPTKIIILRPQFYIISSIAAAAAILLFFFVPSQTTNTTQSFAEIDVEEIYDYVEENINDFEEETLLAFVEIPTIEIEPIVKEISTESNEENFEKTDFTEDDLQEIDAESIENYLNELDFLLEEDENELIELL